VTTAGEASDSRTSCCRKKEHSSGRGNRVRSEGKKQRGGGLTVTNSKHTVAYTISPACSKPKLHEEKLLWEKKYKGAGIVCKVIYFTAKREVSRG